jgi:(2Fe-2S) ferredoxin
MPLWEAIAETGTIVCVLWGGTDLAKLAGQLYPKGIPILPEAEVPELIRKHRVEQVVQEIHTGGAQREGQKGCAGRCSLEPMVEIIEGGKIPVKYIQIDAHKAREIIARHLRKGEVIKEWTIQ